MAVRQAVDAGLLVIVLVSLATRCRLKPQEPSHVVGMVDDVKASANEVDDLPARPQARVVARRFRARHDQTHQAALPGGGQLRGPTRRRPPSESLAAVPTICPLPASHRSPIHAEPLGDDVNRDVTLQQLDGADPLPLKFGRAPLWAHAHPQRRYSPYCTLRDFPRVESGDLPVAAIRLVS